MFYVVKNNHGGFLLEVLLSVVIMGITLTLVMSAMMSSYRGSLDAERYTTATLLAEDLINKSLLYESTEEANKKLEAPFDEFNAQLTESTSDMSVNDSLKLLTMSVGWETSERSPSFKLDAFTFKKPIIN